MNNKRIEAVLTPIRETSLVDLVGLILLIGILFFDVKVWFFVMTIRTLAVIGLLVPQFRKQPWYWFIIGITWFVVIYFKWASIDNHKYVFGYMSLLVGFAYLAPPENQTKVLHKSACWLMGIVFLIAVVQKLINPEYLNGAFFRYTMLTDSRFEMLPHWIAGVTREELGLNQGFKEAIIGYPLPITEPFQLQGWEKVAVLANIMTWWTVFIETLIPIAFLLPSRMIITRFKHELLWVFIVTTYPIAPVLGFAWMLLLMGLCQSDKDPIRIRYIYCGLYSILHLCMIPWH